MNKTEFWKNLDSLSLDDTTVSHDENARIIEETGKKLEEFIPNKLYRYRSFDSNNYNISALENNEIWASRLTEMNDFMEYNPYWNLNETLEILEDSIDYVASIDFKSITVDYPGYKETFGATNNLELLNVNYTKDLIIKYNKFLLMEIKLLIPLLKKNPEIILNYLMQYKERIFAACLSENRCSNKMMAHYADSAKGFILEYETNKLLTPCCNKEICDHLWDCSTLHYSPVLIPINYRKRRYNVSQVICPPLILLGNLNLIQKLDIPKYSVTLKPFRVDYLYHIKLAGRKEAIWKEEKEWRLMYINKRDVDSIPKHIPIIPAKPSAIVLCPNCRKENMEIIKSIANKQSIPLFKLTQDYSGNGFNTLKRKPIN